MFIKWGDNFKNLEYITFFKENHLKFPYDELEYYILFADYTQKFPHNRNIIGIKTMSFENQFSIVYDSKKIIQIVELHNKLPLFENNYTINLPLNNKFSYDIITRLLVYKVF